MGTIVGGKMPRETVSVVIGASMYQKHIQPVSNWFKQAITEPQHELGRWERAVRYAYDLGIYGWKALNRDDAPQMAAALSFRTLFACCLW